VDKFKPDELSPEKTPETVKQALKELANRRENANLYLDLDPNEVKPVDLFQ
jgi:hypothetical protein